MKLVPLFFLLALTLTAQDRAGNVYLDGNTTGEYSRLGFSNFRSVYTPQNALRRFEGLRFDSRSGYFLTNRLLVGGGVSYFISPDVYDADWGYDVFKFSPFVRYYAVDAKDGGTSLFAEAGFGTVGFGRTDDFSRDYHFAVGAERNLAAGILGTATLRHAAQLGLPGTSLTDLTLGLNVLTGQLGAATAAAPLGAGTLSLAGPLGRMAYGRGDLDGGLHLKYATLELSPRITYALLDGLLLETVVDYEHSFEEYRTDEPDDLPGRSRNYTLEAGLRLRYYPLQRGRLLPFVGAGLGYSRVSYRYLRGESDYRKGYESVPWTATAGASYFLSPRLAVDLTADYTRGQAENLRDVGFGAGSERQLRFATGLRFFLPRTR